MNFLKISGLVLGTVSVSGTVGIGIYYADSRNNTDISSNSETDILNSEDSPDNADDEIPLPNLERPIFSATDSLVGNVNSDSNNVQIETIQTAKNSKTQFVGKIVFFKKKQSTQIANYELKIITATQYETQKNAFDRNKTDQNKYDKVHKIIDVSGKLNSGREKTELKRIFSTPSPSSDIKAKILSEATELKRLLGTEIYENLKNKFNS